MVTRIRRVNPVQFALVTATLYAIIVFIFALLWLPFAGMWGAMMGAMDGGTGARWFGAGFGIAVVFVWPIVYFIVSFVFGLIGAALYNLVAGWTGGVEVTLEQTVGAGIPTGSPTI
jgi:hypothetical protein